MHPHWYGAPYHRGPSRLLWFIFGGLAATWWIKRKECHAHAQGNVGFCVRKPIQPPAPAPANLPQPPSEEWTAEARSPSPLPTPPTPPKEEKWSFGPPPAPPFGWEEEKERMLALGRQAGDTVRDKLNIFPYTPDLRLSFVQMAEMSESTLDTVISTVEILKAVRPLPSLLLSPLLIPILVRRNWRNTAHSARSSGGNLRRSSRSNGSRPGGGSESGSGRCNVSVFMIL
jgi:hypothetical protein